MHGWCIPAQGKDFEVKDKEATEQGYDGSDEGILVTDLRAKILTIPAADPGNVIGYEIEHEDRPYILEDDWDFQNTIPTREARYTLQLPPGWEYKARFLNHADVAPTPSGNNQWQWVVTNVPEIKHERAMPPLEGVAGVMVISFVPPGGVAIAGF